MTEFARDGRGEAAKGWYHVALGTIAAGAALYNLWALAIQPRRRVAIGAVGYTALAGVEALVARQHFRTDRSHYVK